MDKNAVKIAEKVMFWEEQDKINQAMIPRVLKNHDMLAALTGQLSGVAEKLGQIEARVAEKQKSEMNHIVRKIAELEQCLNDFEKENAKLLEEIVLLRTVTGQGNQLNSNLLAKSSMVVAVVAIAIALLK